MSTKVAMYQIFYAVSVFLLTAYPLIYIGNYAGDSQVHLIYGQNAAQGAFFEFNLGEKSAGVTSPGYMLLIASFFKIAPDTWVPAMIKVTNILFWYGLIWVVFMVAKALFRSMVWAVIAVLATGLLPGSAYNATNGMENGIFAFLIAVWILLAMRVGWFTADRLWQDSYKSEILLGILLGLACWLRPEGFVVMAIALTYRFLLTARRKRVFMSSIIPSGIFIISFSVIVGGLVWFHWSQTSYLIPTSGSSRILMSNLAPDTLKMGLVFFSPKMAIRLAQYFTLTLPSFIAIWLVLKGNASLQNFREVIGFLIILFWGFFLLYGFVFGALHLSRYIIFIMPALVLLSLIGGKWLWDSWNWSDRPKFKHVPAITAAAAILALLSVYSVETNLRIKLDSQSSLWQSMQAPVERKAFSDELFRQLGQPKILPVTVALQEVQARYWLDDRFIVRSLDGRVDSALLEHADQESVDHIGYLEERQVQYLMDTPDYNKKSEAWSLNSLATLKPGERMVKDGVIFKRMHIDRSGATRMLQAEQGQWRWFKGENGITKLHALLVDLIHMEYPDS